MNPDTGAAREKYRRPPVLQERHPHANSKREYCSKSHQSYISAAEPISQHTVQRALDFMLFSYYRIKGIPLFDYCDPFKPKNMWKSGTLPLGQTCHVSSFLYFVFREDFRALCKMGKCL